MLVESELRMGDYGLAETCVHRVIKSNNQAFPIGLIMENPMFADYLERLKSSSAATGGAIASAESIQAELRDRKERRASAKVEPRSPSPEEHLQHVLVKVETLGYTRENLVTVAKQTFGKYILSELTVDELVILDRRLDAAASRRREADGTSMSANHTKPEGSSS